MGYKVKKFIQLWLLRKTLRRDGSPQSIRINNHILIKRTKNTYQVPNFTIFIIRQSKLNIRDHSHINIYLVSPLKYPRCAVTQKFTNFLTKILKKKHILQKRSFDIIQLFGSLGCYSYLKNIG